MNSGEVKVVLAKTSHFRRIKFELSLFFVGIAERLILQTRSFVRNAENI